jgi:ABC-type nitrate/sulfonate/bicarbonate transport system permease component
MAKRLRQMAGAVKQLPRSVRWSAAAAAVGAFMLWLVLYAPSLFVPTPSDVELRQVDAAKRVELQNDVRTTLLQGLGGLAVLVGAFFRLFCCIRGSVRLGRVAVGTGRRGPAWPG